MSLPSTQIALKVAADSSHYELKKDVPVDTTLKPEQLLIKVHSAGALPVENLFFKMGVYTQGQSTGLNLAGEVVAIGSDVTRFNVGDTVAAFVYSFDVDHKEIGAYQEYTKVFEVNTFKFNLKPAESRAIPAGPVTTFEGGASVVDSIITVGISLYIVFAHTDEKKTILIYGGSTGVGQRAIIFAKHFGWRIIAIASPKHHQFLKVIGADVVIDYHSNDLTQDIKNLDEDIDFAYITTGGVDAIEKVFNALPENKPIKLESIESDDFSTVKGRKPNVTLGFTRAGTSYGGIVDYGHDIIHHPLPNTKEKLTEFHDVVQKVYDAGKLLNNQVEVLPGGLNSVNDALKTLATGANGSTKLVINISDTKF